MQNKPGFAIDANQGEGLFEEALAHLNAFNCCWNLGRWRFRPISSIDLIAARLIYRVTT